MLCTVLLAIGLGAGCVEPPPPRDQAAEVLIEQDRRHQEEFEAAKAKSRKLYERLGQKCHDCEAVNTLPFPVGKQP